VLPIKRSLAEREFLTQGTFMSTRLEEIHPGEILLEDYLKPLGMSLRSLAAALHVPYSRLSAVVRGKRAISADMALRLERFFGSEAQGWLNLQSNYDLRMASATHGVAITSEVQPLHPSPPTEQPNQTTLAAMAEARAMGETKSMEQWRPRRRVWNEGTPSTQNVAELIALLRQFPPDAPVVVEGYETGYDGVHSVQATPVAPFDSAQDWDGEFQSPKDVGINTPSLLGVQIIGRRGHRR
jgi:addiction module HigA family antidote